MDNYKNNWTSKILDEKIISKEKTRINAGDFKITINNPYYDLNPFQLTKRLYRLKHDDSLNKEEKEKKLREIIEEYVGDE